MVCARHAPPVDWTADARPAAARHADGVSFAWSAAKIRIAALVLFGAATPAVLGFAVGGPFARWICLVWLAGIGLMAQGLSRRARIGSVVLSVDERGILDRRLMRRRIAWQEIASIWPVDVARSHVVDIELRWPLITLADTRWRVRIGAHCQCGYGVPALTVKIGR